MVTFKNRPPNNGFLAWLFDAAILECLAGPLRQQMAFEANAKGLVSAGVMLVLLIISLLYHFYYKHRTHWISPGEFLIGTLVRDNGKQLVNPFMISRNILFILVVIHMITLERDYMPGTFTWFGLDNSWARWTFNILFNGLLLTGTAFLCRARWSGLIIIAGALIFRMLAYFIHIPAGTFLIGEPFPHSSLWLLMANIGTGIYYLRRKKMPLLPTSSKALS